MNSSPEPPRPAATPYVTQEGSPSELRREAESIVIGDHPNPFPPRTCDPAAITQAARSVVGPETAPEPTPEPFACEETPSLCASLERARLAKEAADREWNHQLALQNLLRHVRHCEGSL